MPQYEYICEEDGETLTLLRSMKDADNPVEDPAGKGRRFVRRLSSFTVAGSKGSAPLPMRGSGAGGGCACGNPHGPCGH
jgi:putative FmdB family regulatory protein